MSDNNEHLQAFLNSVNNDLIGKLDSKYNIDAAMKVIDKTLPKYIENF